MHRNLISALAALVPLALLSTVALAGRSRNAVNSPAPLWEDAIDVTPVMRKMPLPDDATRETLSEITYQFLDAYRKHGLESSLSLVQPEVAFGWRRSEEVRLSVTKSLDRISRARKIRLGNAGLYDDNHARIAVIVSDSTGEDAWYRVSIGRRTGGAWRINCVDRAPIEDRAGTRMMLADKETIQSDDAPAKGMRFPFPLPTPTPFPDDSSTLVTGELGGMSSGY